MKELEKGKLYQVKDYHTWRIAEYICKVEAHTAKGYRSTDGAKSWREPACHHWRGICYGSFGVYDKDIQIREVTDETLHEIARLRGASQRMEKERLAVQKELKNLCN